MTTFILEYFLSVVWTQASYLFNPLWHLPQVCDISNLTSIASLAKDLVETSKEPLYLLVNNAGEWSHVLV